MHFPLKHATSVLAYFKHSQPKSFCLFSNAWPFSWCSIKVHKRIFVCNNFLWTCTFTPFLFMFKSIELLLLLHIFESCHLLQALHTNENIKKRWNLGMHQGAFLSLTLYFFLYPVFVSSSWLCPGLWRNTRYSSLEMFTLWIYLICQNWMFGHRNQFEFSKVIKANWLFLSILKCLVVGLCLVMGMLILVRFISNHPKRWSICDL